MREMLFRGKNSDSGKWQYFSLGDLVSGEALGKSFYPESWGMWTGLMDKSGTKVFENDVCRWKYFNPVTGTAYEKVGYINYKAPQFRLTDSFNGMEHDWSIGAYSVSELIVLGNVTDTPDLLSQKGEKE